MIERLFKTGIVTTIVGLILMGGAVYMYMSQNFSSMEAGELAALGLLFLRTKDSLIGLGKNGKQKIN
tara:strand:- start:851 stop:1051 length:201 start_codon:yes stop_codon:yes gene_type:complete